MSYKKLMTVTENSRHITFFIFFFGGGGGGGEDNQGTLNGHTLRIPYRDPNLRMQTAP